MQAAPTASSHHCPVRHDDHQPRERAEQEADATQPASPHPATATPDAVSRIGPTRCVVGAAHAVAVVVGVVDADLEGQGDDEGQERPARRSAAAVVRSDPGACGDGGDGGRQRARSGALPPLRGVAMLTPSRPGHGARHRARSAASGAARTRSGLPDGSCGSASQRHAPGGAATRPAARSRRAPRGRRSSVDDAGGADHCDDAFAPLARRGPRPRRRHRRRHVDAAHVRPPRPAP